MSAQADTNEMLFADTAALGLPGLILLAVAIAAFIVWLAVGTREPDVGDVLTWVVAGGIGLAVIAYAGSWHEVAIDAATKQVTERHGYLGYELRWMGQQRGFQDFNTVLVERTTSKEPTDNPKRTRRVHSYTLSLRGAGRQLDLPVATRDDVFFQLRAKPQGSGITLPPMETSGDVLVLEAAALRVARLGSWQAKRNGYVLQIPQNGPASIEIVATDAESLIEAR